MLRTAPRTRPLSVLIVDDDTDTCDSLAIVLTLYGYEARFAKSAEQALRQATLEQPDVVLLDIGMPGTNGWDLARSLRATAKPPILIAVTGYDRPADRELSQEAGVHLHLVKPVDAAVLAGVLRCCERVVSSTEGTRTALAEFPRTVAARRQMV